MTKEWQDKGWKVQVLTAVAIFGTLVNNIPGVTHEENHQVYMQGIPADLSTSQGRQKLILEVSESFGGSLHILGGQRCFDSTVMFS